MTSRTELAGPAAPIHAPEGLAELLAALPRGTRAVLVTNAPEVRLDAALRTLGLECAFAEIVTSAGKPHGLPAIAAAWLADGPVLTIGDIWRNDLAPLAPLGADTALIGAPSGTETPTMHAETLAGLLPSIRRWLADAVDSAEPDPADAVDSADPDPADPGSADPDPAGGTAAATAPEPLTTAPSIPTLQRNPS